MTKRTHKRLADLELDANQLQQLQLISFLQVIIAVVPKACTGLYGVNGY